MIESLLAVFDDPAARMIAYVAGGTLLLGVAATALALASYFKTYLWRRTKGRIRRSEPAFKLVQAFDNEAPRNRRVASINYEFKIDGKTLHSNKVLDSGEPAEDQVDRLLAAYPAGAEATVIYDPKNPSRSALEINGPPPELAKGCLAAALILIVLAAIAIWLVTSGFSQLQGLMPGAILQAMIPTLLLGVLLIVVAVATMRQAAAVGRWPQTSGKITLSRVQEFSVRRDKPQRTLKGVRRMRKRFMPVVEYSYTVGGREYASRSIWADTEVSGDQRHAEGIARRYQPGQTVQVRYDPTNPKRAALEIGRGMYWLFLPAAISLAIAAATSGLLF
jgi:hypothetical protein